MPIDLSHIESSNWIAFASAVVALCALVTSIWQGFVTRRHARLSSKPIIETELNSHVDGGIKIFNCGLGPAVVTRIVATIGDRSFNLCSQAALAPLIETLIPDLKTRLLIQTYVIQPHSTIGVNGEVAIIKIVGGAMTHELSNHLARTFRTMRLEVAYKSIYGEAFVTIHPASTV